VNSGHPGSITSVHAASAELAFEQLVLLVKQSKAGAELARSDIKSLLYLLVDIVVQFGVDRHERFIKEIWYDPARKRSALAAAANSARRALALKIVVGLVAALLVAAYLAGYVLLWSLHLNPRQASPLTVVRYGYYYGDRQEIRRRSWRVRPQAAR